MREEVLFRMVKRYLSIVTCSLLFGEDERVRGTDVIWGGTRLVVGNVEAEQLDAGRGTL